MKLRLRVGAIACASLLAACTTISTSTLDHTLAARIRGATVAVVVEAPATFGVALTRAVALGRLGIPEMVEEGRKLVDDNHIVDPADGVATVPGDSLAGQRGAIVLATHGASRGDDLAAIVAAAPADARYVLDVATVSWAWATCRCRAPATSSATSPGRA